MKVKVIGPYQVVHGDKRYTEGDTFDAPEADAQAWVTAGYVEEDKPAKKAQSDADNKAQDGAANKAASSRSSDKK